MCGHVHTQCYTLVASVKAGKSLDFNNRTCIARPELDHTA